MFSSIDSEKILRRYFHYFDENYRRIDELYQGSNVYLNHLETIGEFSRFPMKIELISRLEIYHIDRDDRGDRFSYEGHDIQELFRVPRTCPTKLHSPLIDQLSHKMRTDNWTNVLFFNNRNLRWRDYAITGIYAYRHSVLLEDDSFYPLGSSVTDLSQLFNQDKHALASMLTLCYSLDSSCKIKMDFYPYRRISFSFISLEDMVRPDEKEENGLYSDNSDTSEMNTGNLSEDSYTSTIEISDEEDLEEDFW